MALSRFRNRLVGFAAAFVLVFGQVPAAAFADSVQAQAESDSSIAQDYVQDYVQGEVLVTFVDDVSATQVAETLSVVTTEEVAAQTASELVDAIEENGEGLGTLAVACDDVDTDAADTGESVIAVQDDAADVGNLVSVELDGDMSVEDAIATLSDDPTVESVQPNYIYTLVDDVDEADDASASDADADDDADEPDLLELTFAILNIPNDPAVKVTLPTTSRSTGNAWQLARVDAFDAWDIATNEVDNPVTVAVLDTGITMDHEDLAANIWQDYAWNAYTDSKLIKDYNGHGTHVAGIVAARANNGIGTAGVSYNAKILPVCVFDETGSQASTATIVKAYNYILSLNKNNSAINLHVVNLSVGGYGSENDDRNLEQAIATAKSAGVVTVCAAGNGDNTTGSTDNLWPSDYEDCVSVTALSTDGKTPTAFSDYNSCKDICAPGEAVYSAYGKKGNKNEYAYLSGTSMAAPVVSGAFALLWAAYPDLSVDKAVEAVCKTADSTNFAPAAGREGLYGAGVLDIDAALEWLDQDLSAEFLGGSLRLDYGDSVDNASLRLGYTVTLPSGVDMSTLEWSWDYAPVAAGSTVESLTAGDLIYTCKGEKLVDNGDGTITTNLVFTGIPDSSYATKFAARINVTCKDKWGREYNLTGDICERSVADVANLIKGSSANDAEIKYAEKLLAKVNAS